MESTINQAVVFTKPLHHLEISLTPEQLDQQVRSFFKEKGFNIVYSKKVSGTELDEREAIRKHYLMYSQASYGDAVATDAGKAAFMSAFGKSWDAEVAAGRIEGNPQLLETKGISPDELFLWWNDQFANRETVKIQDGVIVAWVEKLDCYCINAFYPVMESNFYNPATRMDYYVVEFDASQISWAQFRKEILGATDASKAGPASFRGQLYAKYNVEFPGRDNFVHGSAGPVEGLVERIIHEPGFELEANPVGRYLAGRGVTLDAFSRWKDDLSITQLGDLFDRTEEKDTAAALEVLDTLRF